MTFVHHTWARPESSASPRPWTDADRDLVAEELQRHRLPVGEWEPTQWEHDECAYCCTPVEDWDVHCAEAALNALAEAGRIAAPGELERLRTERDKFPAAASAARDAQDQQPAAAAALVWAAGEPTATRWEHTCGHEQRFEPAAAGGCGPGAGQRCDGCGHPTGLEEWQLRGTDGPRELLADIRTQIPQRHQRASLVESVRQLGVGSELAGLRLAELERECNAARAEAVRFAAELGFGDNVTDRAAPLADMIDPIREAIGAAQDHDDCPRVCELCGETLAATDCERCNGSGNGPGTASGAYEECEYCAGAGRIHEGCAEVSYAKLVGEVERLRGELTGPCRPDCDCPHDERPCYCHMDRDELIAVIDQREEVRDEARARVAELEQALATCRQLSEWLADERTAHGKTRADLEAADIALAAARAEIAKLDKLGLQVVEADARAVRELEMELAVSRTVLAERERELLALRGPCSNAVDNCRLHHAHAGPCAPAEGGERQ